MAINSHLLIYSFNNNSLLLKVLKQTRYSFSNNAEDEISLALFQNNNQPKLGSIYYAKIIKYQKSLDCYFIDLGNNQYALLKNNYQTKLLLKNPTEGQKILVIITKEGDNTKYPVVSLNIAFHGLLVDFIPLNNKISFSSNISIDNKAEITNTIQNAFSDIIGLKIKNIANIINLINEITLKKLFWEQLYKKPLDKIGLLYSPSIALEAILSDSYNIPSKILVNSLSLLETIKNELNTFLPFLNIELIYDNSPHLYIDAISKLEEELNTEITINNEITLHLYNTKALIFIDIDFKPNNSLLNKEDALYDANIKAIPYITKIIKLQNLAGQIFIDVLKIKNKERQNLLLQQYKNSFAKHNLQANIMGFTKLGVLEVERSKTSNSISNQLFNSCKLCNGRGKNINYNLLHLKTLLLLQQIIEKNPLAIITIKSSSFNLEYFKKNNSKIINNMQNHQKINFIIDDEINKDILVY